jgi:hypothetical protein
VHHVEAIEDAPAGTWKDFLLESEGLDGAATPVSAGRLLIGGGARKEEGLVSPDDGVERGAYVVPTLLVPYNTSLQLLFYKHSQLKQLVDGVKLLIIYYVMNIAPQTRVKMTNRILSSLYYATTHQTILKLTIIVLYKLISLF